MSSVKIEGNASGTGVFTIASPNSNTNRTLTLPDNTGTILTSATTTGFPAGSIIQVKNVTSGTYATTTTLIPIDNTIPQNTEGAEFFTLAITPTSTTSKLLIIVSAQVGSGAGVIWHTIALFQDSTANALASMASYIETSGGGYTAVLTHFMTAGTTSSTTFKLRYGPNTGTGAINGTSSAIFNGTCATSMTIMEIAA